jgi:hypothetical protein
MYRRIALALSASLLTAAAHAVTLPSNLMLPEPERAARGYVESWVLTIAIESDNLTGLDACRKILTDHGFKPALSKTASSAAPALHFKISGSKEYAQASTEADDTLQAVQQAKCPGNVSWNVVSRPARR